MNACCLLQISIPPKLVGSQMEALSFRYPLLVFQIELFSRASRNPTQARLGAESGRGLKIPSLQWEHRCTPAHPIVIWAHVLAVAWHLGTITSLGELKDQRVNSRRWCDADMAGPFSSLAF
mmetsp:Transcript_15008/g.41566  ORF Transcript_15008/g.41566 Transcript_15008/m.41566 type:complete len:121 (-) Transcript_15008:338-700(-)